MVFLSHPDVQSIKALLGDLAPERKLPFFKIKNWFQVLKKLIFGDVSSAAFQVADFYN